MPYDDEDGYDYDLEPEDPMLAAVKRARQQRAETPEQPAAPARPGYTSDEVSNDWGADLTNELTVERDAGRTSPGESREDRKAAEYEEETGLPAQPTGPGYTPAVANDEYADALRRIKASLSKPPADVAGLAAAQKKDENQNRAERIMAFLSAGLRRVPTPSFAPAATNAAGFLQRQQLQQQGDNTETSRLAALARLTRPAKAAGAGKDPGDVDRLRSVFVKSGLLTEEQVAGMNEAQLKAAASAIGMVTDNKRADAQFDETKRHNKETEGAAWAAANRSENNKVDAESRELAGKLGDSEVFEQRYNRLQELAKANGGQLPGLGVVEGVRQQPGVLGSVARAISPPTPQAVEGRKLLKQLAADYAREISGAGVSDRERATLNSATIDVDNDDSSIAMAGLKTLKEMYDTKVRTLKRGYRPEAVDRVAGGATVNVRFPNGKVVPVPQAEVEEATSKFGGEVVQ